MSLNLSSLSSFVLLLALNNDLKLLALDNNNDARMTFVTVLLPRLELLSLAS